MAYVTFRQPYAFQTALLLNGATVGERPVSILPLQESEVPVIMDEINNETHQKKHGVMTGIIYNLKKSKDKLQAELVHHTRSDIGSATAIPINIVKKKKDYVSAGALWLSGVLDKASNQVSQQLHE